MLEMFLSLLERLPDWEIYREVAAHLDGEELASWRRFYDTRPSREGLIGAGLIALAATAKRRIARPRN
jgi:hypothetical protein